MTVLKPRVAAGFAPVGFYFFDGRIKAMKMKYKNSLFGAVLFFLMATAAFGKINSAHATFVENYTNDSQIQSDVRKGPYLIYPGKNTEMEVLWQLKQTESCKIEWGTDTTYSLGSQQSTEYGNSHQHKYLITNLQPGEKYFYRVITSQDTCKGSFHEAPDTSATQIKFFVYGDTRSYPADHDKVAKKIISTYTNNPDFQTMIIATGDYVSNGDYESNWDNQFFNRSYKNIQTELANLPYQGCMGNHEHSGVLFKKYFPYPFMSHRYWSFDYGPAHFVIIDQYTDYSSTSAQYKWIESDLASTQKPWKFLVFHEPGWSAGGHSNNLNVQRYIQPLCEKYGVPMVFNGHNHYYSRAVVNGVCHITAGGGGAPLYSPSSNYPYIVATAKKHHFCKVEIKDNLLTFTAIASDGSIIDKFTLNEPTAVSTPKRKTSPRGFMLYPAFPNPFNPVTTISFSLPRRSNVILAIYNIKGEIIKTLANRKMAAGFHGILWNGTNRVGEKVPSGEYICQLKTRNYKSSTKIILIK